MFGIGAKESSEQASDWSAQHALSYPVSADPEGEVFKRFAAGSVPYHIMIDRNFDVALSQEAFDKDLLIQTSERTLSYQETK